MATPIESSIIVLTRPGDNGSHMVMLDQIVHWQSMPYVGKAKGKTQVTTVVDTIFVEQTVEEVTRLITQAKHA